jgi:acyl carrier protein
LDPGLVNYLGGGSPFDRVELAMAFEESFETERSDEEIETIGIFRADEEAFDYRLRRGEGGR